MKRSIAVLLTLGALASQAQAQDTVAGQVLGTIAGAVIGNQFGGGNGKVAMTVIGGVIGNEVGRNLSRPQVQGGYYPPMEGQPPVYQTQQLPPEQKQFGFPYPDEWNRRIPSSRQAWNARNRLNECVGDGYFQGVYNPQAALSYCRGMLEAEQVRQARLERDAYNQGFRDNR